MSDDDFDADDEFESRPLGQQEAAMVRRDIDDLAAFRRTFEPEGYKGVSMFCTDCVEEHYYGWDMLEGNLRTLLESGDYPVHEPPYDPRPDEYINWEYAQGYVDGLVDTTPQPLPLRSDTQCPFCAADLGEARQGTRFCPSCGTPLGLAALADALVARGMPAEEIQELFAASGLPVPAMRDQRSRKRSR